MLTTDTKVVPVGDRFDIDPQATEGLSLRVRGGVLLVAAGMASMPNATLTLTASTRNFVEVSDAGVISANTTGFTEGATPLYLVTTGAALVTGIEDWRGLSRPNAEQAMTASGAIRPDAELVTLNSTTPLIAATITAPRKGRFLVITQLDGGTAGHTVTLAAGTWDGTNDVATLNAAGETLIVYGISATRFIIVENIGAVAFS